MLSAAPSAAPIGIVVATSVDPLSVGLGSAVTDAGTMLPEGRSGSARTIIAEDMSARLAEVVEKRRMRRMKES